MHILKQRGALEHLKTAPVTEKLTECVCLALIKTAKPTSASVS